MAGFAAWLAGHRFRRIAFIAGLFPLPFTGLVSAAIVVFSAASYGPRKALTEVSMALLLLVLMGLLVGSDIVALAGGALLSWGFACLLGSLVHRYRSLTLALQSAVLVSITGMALFVLIIGDDQAFWLAWLNSFTNELSAQGMESFEPAVLEQLSVIMTATVSASFLLSAILALLLGTAWWAGLQGGSLGQLFRSFSLGYIVGGVAALLGIAALVGLPLAGDMLVVTSLGFVLQGIAVLACWAEQRKWSGSWWAIVIVPLLLMAILPVPAALVAMGLAAIGFIDNWYSLRPQVGHK